jgi:DNA-binding MarR family transcriptional regulator
MSDACQKPPIRIGRFAHEEVAMVKIRPADEPAAAEPARKRGPRPLDLPGENGDIAALLRQAASAQRLAEERLIADLGVTPPQLSALGLIGAHPGLLAADLARKAKLTPQTVSLIVANLRRAGLAREEENGVSTASRARPLALTVDGEKILRLGRERTEAASARLIEGMRPKREKALRRWLAAIVAGVQQPGALETDDL